MQGSVERTQTVTVMERKVAETNGTKTEVGVPRQIFVRPMPMRRWVKALGFVGTVIQNLPNTGLDLDNPMQMALWITHVLGKVPDEIFSLMELATDEPADLFDRIDLDEGIKVMVAVVEVNKDFFVQRVLPFLAEIQPRLKEKASILGQTQ